MKVFLEDLNLLHEEHLNCDDFKKKYHRMNPALDLLPDIWGGLSHFLTDWDIRAKDTEYKDMQKRELKKLIALIENGAPLTELQKIHFLGSTD